MSSQRRFITQAFVLCAALAALTGFAPSRDDWKRVQVGSTPLTMEIPGDKFKAGEVEKSEAQGDWVKTSQDFDFENDDYFVRATVFEGRPGTKADATFLKTVMKSVLKELDGSQAGPKEIERSDSELGDHPAVRGVYSVHPEKKDENYVVSLTLVGDGEKVYSVSIVSYPDLKAGTESAARTHKSVEFKKK
ncbi:MAG: hypothetical protein KF857_00660 [Fimbriimonadaceae bacterium]|nr:hypothetical protein [Fimbriimonadaceae bacterium]